MTTDRASKRRTGRLRRHRRVRKGVRGTPERPRLSVFRSSRHMAAQVIDDTAGVTLVSASTLEPGLRAANGGNVAAAAGVGTVVAERALTAGISAVVFDRGGYRYHGRVAALADAARRAGLEF